MHVPELLHEGSTKTPAAQDRKKGSGARFARIFYVLMITTCGLMGLFFIISQELYESITITGRIHADAGMVLFCPLIRFVSLTTGPGAEFSILFEAGCSQPAVRLVTGRGHR
jgi:hypothetical protein